MKTTMVSSASPRLSSSFRMSPTRLSMHWTMPQYCALMAWSFVALAIMSLGTNEAGTGMSAGLNIVEYGARTS